MMLLRRLGAAVACGILAIAVACGNSDAEDGTASSSSGSSGRTSDGGTNDASIVPVGGACVSDDRCEGRCIDGKCAAPTTTDGKISPSLGETDVDCGGATAPACADGRGCAADGDCTTTVCSASKRCAPASSCRGTSGPSGIETCGTGEVGAPGAAHESCCKTLPLPTTTTRRLGKYEITAGRFREFMTALAATNGGDADIRTYAKTYATANPGSQLGKILTSYPGLLDILPNTKSTGAALPLAVHLGAFPLDPMNSLDGCFVGPGSYGHATYWQPPGDLAPFGVGYPSSAPDGVRKYSREELDAKPLNCVMPLIMAAFCNWDGGELARTSDYREIFGRQSSPIGNGLTVFYPWDQLLTIGQFNWRNGNGEQTCSPPSLITGWPNCQSPQPAFYTATSPTVALADDETPYISAPGRFPLDVTKIRSSNGEGWFDIGGDMLEAAWPNTNVDPGPVHIVDVCDTSASTGGPGCSRPATGLSGIRRFEGELPQIAMIGYSFEGHQRRSEGYLASTDGDEARLIPNDLHPATFQYGKLGGRCVYVGK
jgi:hypothetical protein